MRRQGALRHSSWCIGPSQGLLDATERQDRGCGGADARMHPECTGRRPKNFAFEDAEGGGVAGLRLQSYQVAGPGRHPATPGRLPGFEHLVERVLRTIRACQRAIGASAAGPDGSSGPSWSVLQTFACFLLVPKYSAEAEAPSHQRTRTSRAPSAKVCGHTHRHPERCRNQAHLHGRRNDVRRGVQHPRKPIHGASLETLRTAPETPSDPSRRRYTCIQGPAGVRMAHKTP